MSHYTELVYFDPALAVDPFELQSHPNTGNLKKVIFDPTNDAVAWVLNWSANNVYTWEGSLRTAPQNSYAMSGYTLWNFDVSSDGTWKIFVGRDANIWLSDSTWRPIQANRFYSEPIPGWTQPPWSGTNNDYLWDVAFKPGACEGIAVGDATSNQGTIAHFSL